MSHTHLEPPLHAAVLANQTDAVQRISQEIEARHATNWLGFTALELALLLGKQQDVDILDPTPKPPVRLWQQGRRIPHDIARSKFKLATGVHYLSHLQFASYEQLQQVIRRCPRTLLTGAAGEENRQLGQRYRQKIEEGNIAPVTIAWIDEQSGYGVFAARDIAVGEFIGEYTGYIRRLSRWRPDFNGYCLHYPTCWWSMSYYVIDAWRGGNALRFCNHSDDPNLQPLCAVDRGLLHMLFEAKEPIPSGVELTFDYGPDYWRRRQKW